jgi:hypothetical protein
MKCLSKRFNGDGVFAKEKIQSGLLSKCLNLVYGNESTSAFSTTSYNR